MAVNKISGFSTYNTNKLCGSTNVTSARIGSHLITQPISYVSSRAINGTAIGILSAEIGDLVIVGIIGYNTSLSSSDLPYGYSVLRYRSGGVSGMLAYKYLTSSDALNFTCSNASYLANAVFRNAVIINHDLQYNNNVYCKAPSKDAAAGNIGLVICQYPNPTSKFLNSGTSGGYIMSANGTYNANTVWYKSYTSAGTVGGSTYPYVYTNSGGYTGSYGFTVVLASA